MLGRDARGCVVSCLSPLSRLSLDDTRHDAEILKGGNRANRHRPRRGFAAGRTDFSVFRVGKPFSIVDTNTVTGYEANAERIKKSKDDERTSVKSQVLSSVFQRNTKPSSSHKTRHNCPVYSQRPLQVRTFIRHKPQKSIKTKMAEENNDNKEKSGASQVILIILAIFLPPLAVFLAGENCGMHFWLNVLLCCFLWVPGILHALWVILK
jgi:uncharacterized membrane protein YqaE (UPF0057 family)